MVQIFLDEVLGVKPMFYGVQKKSFEIGITHPLNPNWQLMLKKMDKVWVEISPSCS
jgi:hypothetical protein